MSLMPSRLREAVAAPALESLADAWRAQAEELRGWGAAQGAKALERAAADLDAALAAEHGAVLSMREASERSGYAPDSLRHLVRDGKLRAERRGRRLYFRAGDLPKKRPSLDGPHHTGYDPAADARRVAGQRTMRD